MIFNHMCEAVDSIIKKIHELPFNTELKQGSLPKKKFIFYLIQDALYLSDFSRALAIAAARLSDHQQMQQFIQFAQQAMTAERELHFQYMKMYSSSPSSLPSSAIAFTAAPTPACFMYTNYLLKTASMDSVEESVASLLPCFWVYREVGKKIAATANQRQPIHAHPYSEWIALYSGEPFDLSVQTAIDITNQMGAFASDHHRQKMIAAFVRSTQLEWLFWDSAYREEEWLV